jgi:hypothetical protein
MISLRSKKETILLLNQYCIRFDINNNPSKNIFDYVIEKAAIAIKIKMILSKEILLNIRRVLLLFLISSQNIS